MARRIQCTGCSGKSKRVTNRGQKFSIPNLHSLLRSRVGMYCADSDSDDSDSFYRRHGLRWYPPPPAPKPPAKALLDLPLILSCTPPSSPLTSGIDLAETQRWLQHHSPVRCDGPVSLSSRPSSPAASAQQVSSVGTLALPPSGAPLTGTLRLPSPQPPWFATAA